MNPMLKMAAMLALALPMLSPEAKAATSNPMESVGVEHNVYLACLTRPGTDPSVSALRRVVEECGFRPGMSTDDFEAKYAAFIAMDSTQSIVARMDPYRASYSRYQFSFFERVDQLFASVVTAKDADAGLARLEQEAIGRLTSGSRADQSVLAMLSTARHSLAFWTSTTGVYGEATAKSATRAKLKINWGRVLEVCAADLIAGGLGTLIGGPVLGGGLGAAASASV